MWAINGAATVAGTSFAAILGIAQGSRIVLLCGLVCYLVATLEGLKVLRTDED